MEENGSNMTWGYPDNRLWVVRLKASFMSIESVLGILGNLIVVLFTLRRNTFPRNANIYIFAMAVADFIKCIGFVAHVEPFLHQSLTESEAWCKGWGYVLSALNFSSVHLVTCISVDRCLAVWWSRYAERVTPVKSVVLSLAVYCVGALATFLALSQGGKVMFYLREGRCTFGAPDEASWVMSGAFFVLILVPLVTTVIANVLICCAMSTVGVDSNRALPDRINQPADPNQIELAADPVAAPRAPRPGHSAWPEDEHPAPPAVSDKPSAEETRSVTETTDPMDPPAAPTQEDAQPVEQTGRCCCKCSRAGSKSLIALAMVAFGLQALKSLVKFYDWSVAPVNDDVYFALVWLSNSHAFVNVILYSVVHRNFQLSLATDCVSAYLFLRYRCGGQVEPQIQSQSDNEPHAENQPPNSI